MGKQRLAWWAALGQAAALLLAVLAAAPATALTGVPAPSRGAAVSGPALDDLALAMPTGKHLIAKPVKRLPWSPAEPVRWSSLLLVLLTALTFGVVTTARRSWRWCPLAWRAPPVSAVA